MCWDLTLNIFLHSFVKEIKPLFQNFNFWSSNKEFFRNDTYALSDIETWASANFKLCF